MTDEELAKIEADVAKGYLTEDWRLNHLAPLVADVRRLRGLIKKSEDGTCRWCDQWRDGPEARLHAADCPAFTPDGQVK